jgi:tripeptide aminopeptidase
VIAGYDGSDIELRPGLLFSPEQFSMLREQVGKTLIVTGGDTLLGADDKAGIAIIMAVLENLAGRPDFAHAPLRIAFVPDEEIGHGARLLDIAAFGAAWALTLDGSGLGTLQYENFNAAQDTVDIRGLSIHPGYALGHMVNAVLIGQEFLNALPGDEIPAKTEGYQGFYHVTEFTGDVAHAVIRLLIRDHDDARFAGRKAGLHEIAAGINAALPAPDGPRLTLSITDQYRNMREKMLPHMDVVEKIIAAMRACGVEPRVKPVRGGTDGAQLSWRGLPCPNLFVGDYNSHGPFECVALEDMQACVAVVLRIVS